MKEREQIEHQIPQENAVRLMFHAQYSADRRGNDFVQQRHRPATTSSSILTSFSHRILQQRPTNSRSPLSRPRL